MREEIGEGVWGSNLREKTGEEVRGSNMREETGEGVWGSNLSGKLKVKNPFSYAGTYWAYGATSRFLANWNMIDG